jgi:hypothetical protein
MLAAMSAEIMISGVANAHISKPTGMQLEEQR